MKSMQIRGRLETVVGGTPKEKQRATRLGIIAVIVEDRRNPLNAAGRYAPDELAENHHRRGLRILTFVKPLKISRIAALEIGTALALHQGRLKSSLKREIRVAARPGRR